MHHPLSRLPLKGEDQGTHVLVVVLGNVLITTVILYSFEDTGRARSEKLETPLEQLSARLRSAITMNIFEAVYKIFIVNSYRRRTRNGQILLKPY